MELLRVVYRLELDPSQAGARAEALSREQTVEVPRSVVRDAFVRERIVGRVEEVGPHPAGGAFARIAFPVEATAHEPTQLLGVLFGNASLHADVRLEEVEVPPSLLTALGGPRFGLEGLRKRAGVEGRPLTCTALKPLGLRVPALAALCETFARSGIDLIKDDQGLGDHPFCRFEERVTACQAAVARVARETGRRALYVPHLSGPPRQLAERLRFAEAYGVGAVMVAPMLIGLPAFWELCQEQSSLPVLAHPSFGGAQRIAPETLFGQLFRLYGADAVIFTHFGGRFALDRESCRRLADALRRPWGPVRPALPVAGGGIQVDRAAEVIDFYGRDVVLLIGGSLLEAGDGLAERCRRFTEEVRRAAEASPGGAR